MNSEERPATGRTAYRRIINIVCLGALSNYILQIFERSDYQNEANPSGPLPRGGSNGTAAGQGQAMADDARRPKVLGKKFPGIVQENFTGLSVKDDDMA